MNHAPPWLLLPLTLHTFVSTALAKLPEPDAIFFGPVKHKGGTLLLPENTGDLILLAKLNGVTIARFSLKALSSQFVLKVPVDDGQAPRLTGTAGQSSLVPASTDGLAVGMNAIGPNIRTNATITAIDDTAGTLTLSGTHLASVNATISFYLNAPSAKRFASRTGTTTSARPRLTVNYVPATPPPATRRKQWEAANYLVGQHIDDAYDTDGDSITDGLEYAWGFQPNAPNILSSGFSVSPPAADAVTLTFRRDPLATDLTYRAQVSTDMVSWSTIATSTAGATPTGPGFVSESTVDVSFRSVTVRDSFSTPSPKRLYRLSVSRQ